MQKTWRLSDILILLVLLLTGLLLYWQTEEGKRIHERVNDAVKTANESRKMQIELLDSVAKLRKTVSRLKTGTVVVENGSANGGEDGSGDGDGSKPNEVPEEEKYGDTIIRHCPTKIRTLNPLTYKDAYGSRILDNLYDTMIERDYDTLEWKPAMAESWTISDDKLTYTFTLRENLLWSDGKPITSEDVVFSYETIMNPAVDAARIATYYKDLESVKALDARRVEFKYKKPYFLSLSQAGGITIIPKHVYQFEGEEGGKNFSGLREPTVFSGRYVLEKWDQGVEIVLRRNRRYWGKKAYFDRVKFRVIEESGAAFQMLKAGKLDVLSLQPKQYLDMKDTPELMARYQRLKYPNPSSGYLYFGWNNKSKYFDDRRVRLAMTHLVPRERIRTELFHGLAQTITGPFWPGSGEAKVALQYDLSIKPYTFSPARAVQLLNEAGWRDTDNDGILDKNGEPLEFQLMIPGKSEQLLDSANLAAEAMAKVGVKLRVFPVEWTVFTKKLDERSFDACALGWTGGVEGDPYQIWHSSSYGRPPEAPGSNHIGFNSPEADRLIEQARQELDTGKRNVLYNQFHQLLHREQPYTFLFHRPSLIAVHRRFEGVKVHVLGLDSREWWTREENRLDPNR